MDFDINKELESYALKKIEDSNDVKIGSNSEMLDILANMNKTSKKVLLSNMSSQQQFEKVQKENEQLYKEKLLVLEEENIELRKREKEHQKRENAFLKRTINIIDEFYRLKYYADNSGNERLMDTIGKNLKSVRRELSNINIRIIDAVGEVFDENYHECVEVRDDNSIENMTIVEEIRPGFIYNEKVIRPSEVVVIKNNL